MFTLCCCTATESSNDTLKDVDLSVFKEDLDGDLQCDGKPTGKCRGMRRVNTLLRYHHRLLMGSNVANPRSIFTDFCDIAYDPRVATNDYIHYIQKHSDNDSRRQIVKELDLKCTAIGQCGGSLRHYGRSESVSDGLPYHPLLEQFDTLHFNVFHIEEAGFRVVVDDELNDQKVEDHDVDKDAAMEIVSERTRAMNAQFDAERWNGGENGKFNISVQTNLGQKQKGILLHFTSMLDMIKSTDGK